MLCTLFNRVTHRNQLKTPSWQESGGIRREDERQKEKSSEKKKRWLHQLKEFLNLVVGQADCDSVGCQSTRVSSQSLKAQGCGALNGSDSPIRPGPVHRTAMANGFRSTAREGTPVRVRHSKQPWRLERRAALPKTCMMRFSFEIVPPCLTESTRASSRFEHLWG